MTPAALHPAHSTNRSRLARALALYLEANVMAGEEESYRREPHALLVVGGWPQDYRDSLAVRAKQNPGFSDETWTEVVEILAERMAARLGIEAITVHAPLPCGTCHGWGVTRYDGPVPSVSHVSEGRLHEVLGESIEDHLRPFESCGECLRGYVPCQQCGDALAVLRLDGHRVWKDFEVCQSCARIPVEKLLVGDVDPAVVGSSPGPADVADVVDGPESPARRSA